MYRWCTDNLYRDILYRNFIFFKWNRVFFNALIDANCQKIISLKCILTWIYFTEDKENMNRRASLRVYLLLLFISSIKIQQFFAINDLINSYREFFVFPILKIIIVSNIIYIYIYLSLYYATFTWNIFYTINMNYLKWYIYLALKIFTNTIITYCLMN